MCGVIADKAPYVKRYPCGLALIAGSVLALPQTTSCLSPTAKRAIAATRVNVVSSIAVSTMREYAISIRRYAAFAKEIGREPAPVSNDVHILFVSHEGERTQSFNMAMKADYAVAWLADLVGTVETDVPPNMRKRNLMGLKKRLFIVSVPKKVPSTALLRIWLTTPPTTMPFARCQCVLAIVFGAGLRLAEALAMTLADLFFDEFGVQIFIRQSKTDKFRAGAEGFIATQKRKTCLVRIIKKYLWYAGISGHQSPIERQAPIFRALRYDAKDRASFVVPARITEDQFGFNLINKHVSISQIRQDFHRWQERTTPHSTGYTYHASGRAAFATSLHAAGIDPTSIKIAARWSDDSNMHLRYINMDKKRAATLSDQVCAQLH